MTENTSTRVNSARLSGFIGKTVRLACKVLNFSGDVMVVEASDGGQVTIQVPSSAQVSDTYVEIVGSVIDATSIKMMACIGLGGELDLKLINDTIELIHDPRFYSRMFSAP
ncbi:replication factor A protein 3 [Infundibulicybe gibba]|nr:replication factor A protein 3 [Infundibulicybe gibba]